MKEKVYKIKLKNGAYYSIKQGDLSISGNYDLCYGCSFIANQDECLEAKITSLKLYGVSCTKLDSVYLPVINIKTTVKRKLKL
jgi:hypothetical protein